MSLFCPLLSDPNIKKEFDELVDLFGEDMAYYLWDRNKGYGLDKAPNGADSKLFNTLLEYFGDRKQALIAKKKVYTYEFFNWFGDWTGTMSELYAEGVERTLTEDGKIKLSLPSHTKENPRQLVLEPQGNDKYYVHIRIWDGDHIPGKITDEDKLLLFNALYNELPVGGEILFPKSGEGYYGTRGTVAALKRLSRDPRFSPGEKGVLLYKDNPESEEIKEYEGTGFIKKDFSLVSKVVDENGEPFVVWHGTSGKFDEFKAEYSRTASKGFFFSVDKNVAKEYGNTLPLYLNIKNIKEETGFANFDLEDNKYDGYSYFLNDAEAIVVWNPNQIKHIENLGTWNPNDNNMYRMEGEIKEKKLKYSPELARAGVQSTFGSIADRLINNESVQSSEIFDRLLEISAFSGRQKRLAEVLKYHNIPVRLVSLPGLVLATTYTDENGNSVIAIDPDIIPQVSNKFVATLVMHEMIHALTVDAINNPTTEAARNLKRVNSEVYRKFNKLLPASKYNRNNIHDGYYVLNSEKEFVAVFASDENARIFLYNQAKKLDSGVLRSAFRNIVNAISRFFANKDVIKTNAQRLTEYQNTVENYLYNKPVINNMSGNDIENAIKEVINRDYNTDQIENYIIKESDLTFKLNNFEKNHYEIPYVDPNAKYNNKSASYKSIARMLNTRLLSITHSQVDSATKISQSLALMSLIHMFNSESASKYLAITMSLQQIIPLLLEDSRNLRSMPHVSNDDYIYQRHSNFEMYSKLMKDIGDILSDRDDVSEMIEGYNAIVESDADKIGAEDISRLVDQVADAKTIADGGVELTKRILDKNLKRDLSDIANRVGDEDMPDYLDLLHQIDYDTSMFQRYLGSADSARDNGLRAISHLVSSANRKAELDMEPVILKLIKLQRNLKSGESALQLYELDLNGRTTGYLTRKRNYGAFYKNYDAFLKQLNKTLGLRETNRIAPESEDKIEWETDDKKKITVTKREYWNLERNRWLDKHCHRKKVRAYYDAWAKVSTLTKRRLDDINSQILAIYSLPGVMEGKYPRYDKLSDDDFTKLKNLIFRKKLLKSRRDIFGQLKTGVDLQIAEELEKLSKDLSEILEKLGKKLEFKRDDQAWADARASIIEEAGGVEEYQKYLNDEENNFNYKLLNKWDSRNSKQVFKTDDEGNYLVFLAIEAEFGEPKPDYGEEYNKITAEINEILRPHYIINGNMDDEFLSTAAKGYVKELLKKQRQIKYEATKNNKSLSEKSKRYNKIFEKYIEFVDTERFAAIKRNLYAEFGDQGLDLLQALLLNYGTAQYDRNLGMYKNFRPFRWYQKMQAKNAKKYMELVPGDAWIDYSDNDMFDDKNFDASENATMVPRMDYVDPKTGKKIYDNSLAYSVFDKNSSNYSPTLRALYDGILETNSDANAKMKNRTHVDNYQISQVTGSFWKRMKRHGFWGVLKNIGSWIGEHLGIINSGSEEDMGWGQLAERTMYDDSGTPINDTDLGTGTMPDGRQLNVIPQYFTKKLDDPSKLSSDIVGITLMYYKSACLYDRRSKIQNTCEAIVDMMHDRVYYTRDMLSGSFKRTEKPGSSSNTYGMARTFLDMNLYDIRKKSLFGFNIGNKRFETAKFLSTVRRYTTANNLGANPKVGVVGLLTSTFAHIINSIVGEKYGMEESIKAAGIVHYSIAKNLFGLNYVGNLVTGDKLLLLNRKYNTVGSQEALYSHTNRNSNLLGRVAQAVYQHSIYGIMSSLDFLIKSQIAVSVLYSYRYVDGKFMTKNDIINNRWQHGNTKEEQEAWLNEKLGEWKKGITLYDAFTVNGDHLEMDSKYQEAYDKIDFVVKKRIEKFSEAADGMATEEQKAAITQNAIGALALIHRQYLPLTIQERFGESVYDYDTQMYKNGHFKNLIRFAINLAMSSPLFGAAIGGSIGFFMFNPLMAFALGGAGVAAGIYGKSTQKLSAKEVVNLMFNDFSTSKSTHISYHNRYLMKQIFWELLLIYAIKQGVSAICAWAAKDDDDDDSQWKEWIAYVARAFEWEVSTPYNFVDMLDNVKTASPATGTLDKIEDVGGMLQGLGSSLGTWAYYSMFPRESLIDHPFLTDSSEISTFDDLYVNLKVKSGVYKDEYKWERTLQKMHPFHNMKEQMYGSKRKRQYIEDRVMRIDK